jgi:hypothetical protein
MAVGNSGRIVIEVDAEFKKALYSTLEKQQLTLKEWFIRNAQSYVDETIQPSLFSPAATHQEETI